MTFKETKGSNTSGSPTAGEPEYLVVGLLRRPHGLKGELLMEVITDFPERLRQGTNVYIGTGHRLTVISRTRKHPDGLVIKLKGIDSPEAAGDLRMQTVYVSAADRPRLPDGMYYHHELIGFDVLDEQDRRIGRLKEILQTGANDVYVVSQDGGGEVLLPVIASVVLGVDRARREIRIREMPGLLDGA